MKAADAVGLVFFGNLPVNWPKIIMAFSKRFYHLFYLCLFGMSFYITVSVQLQRNYILIFLNYVSEQFNAIEST